MFAIRSAFSRVSVSPLVLRPSAVKVAFRPPIALPPVRPLHIARVAPSTSFCARRWITLAVACGILFGATLHGSAEAQSRFAALSLALSQTTGLEWVRECTQRYPEVLWLGSGAVRHTQEGTASLQGSYSERLFGKKYIEFDRTIMTLHCLRLILDGSESAYQEFTVAQSESEKLSKTSFEKLHAAAIALIESRRGGLSRLEMIQALETALVLGDIGKSEEARRVFNPYGCSAPDHDVFHGEVMDVLPMHPELCPSFARLKSSARNLLVRTANLAHYGHITHLEGGPEMFSRLKARGANPDDFEFDFFVHLCDIAGALGHVNNRSSLVYTEPVAKALQAVARACRVLADPTKSEQDAYDTYLATRANWLGLDSTQPIGRLLTRFGAMLWLYTPQEGKVLGEAFGALLLSDQAAILEQNKRCFARTPTHVPAMFVNLAGNKALGSTKEQRLAAAVHVGLPFWARALREAKEKADVPLNFNAMAGVAKTDPERLRLGRPQIMPDGLVSLLEDALRPLETERRAGG